MMMMTDVIITRNSRPSGQNPNLMLYMKLGHPIREETEVGM
jgi:hypothetical protein